jgi:hypothetical protein
MGNSGKWINPSDEIRGMRRRPMDRISDRQPDHSANCHSTEAAHAASRFSYGPRFAGSATSIIANIPAAQNFKLRHYLRQSLAPGLSTTYAQSIVERLSAAAAFQAGLLGGKPPERRPVQVIPAPRRHGHQSVVNQAYRRQWDG